MERKIKNIEASINKTLIFNKQYNIVANFCRYKYNEKECSRDIEQIFCKVTRSMPDEGVLFFYNDI